MRTYGDVLKIIGGALLVAGAAYVILAAPGLISDRESTVVVQQTGATPQ